MQDAIPARDYTSFRSYPAVAGLREIRTLPCRNTCASSGSVHILYIRLVANAYIPIPIPPPAGIAGVSSLIFATTDSVVRSVEATLVAF